MAGRIRSIILIFVIVVMKSESARILAYFPTPSISHQVVFRPITQELAKRGHEVIVVTPNPVFTDRKPPDNLTEIDVHEVSYNSWSGMSSNHRGNKNDIIVQMLAFFERFATVLDKQLQTPAVKDMLKNKDKKYFDILLLEACNRPLLGLVDKFDAPAIWISSMGAASTHYWIFGAPSHPLLYPTPGNQRIYNLSVWEKGMELFKQVGLYFILLLTMAHDTGIAKKNFGDQLPHFKELTKKVKMMFINEHPIWADNHPVPPSMQFIGGIHMPEKKELPQDLKKYLDSSKHGVIYVSFGTNVLPSLLPAEKIEVMTKVFSELPYDILWKWDNDTLPGQSENIKISSWFPQTDLLRHPNVKLFITQGGLQSTDEAINAAVPLIGIPMLGDQWYNVEKYVHHKIGAQLDITTISEEDLKQTIFTVIGDKSYKENITRLRTLMRSHPIKPLDNTVWWIEHVIAHGGDHLQSPAAMMLWTEYYEVKLVVVGLILITTSLFIFKYILSVIFKLICKCFKSNTKIKVH